MSGRRVGIRGHGIPEHPQPFPPAVRVDRMIFSSAIGGYDPSTGELPGEIADQTKFAFVHMAKVMERGGGSLCDVAKVTVYLADRGDRAVVNPFWIEAFPDETDRPVRHTVVSALPAGMRIQLEFIGVLPE